MTDVVADQRLLRLGHPIAFEEVYPAFQFDDDGIRWELEPLLPILRRRMGDHQVADWLIRSNPAFAYRSPLDWLAVTKSLQPVLDALPEPTRPLPGGDDRADRASAAHAWRTAQTEKALAVRRRLGADARRRRKRVGRPPPSGPVPV